MESFFIVLIFIFVLYFAFKNSAVSLAIILNIVVFRAIPYVDYKYPYYGYYNENDILLGAILPILCFLIIILKVLWKKKKIKFHVDVFDFFMLLLTLTMVLSIVISPFKTKSIYYTGIYLFLSLPFYLVTKLYFSNVVEYQKKIYHFFFSIVFFAFIFSIISLYLHSVAKYPYERMTFPGVYPIPFCLFLCLAFIILIAYQIKPNFKIGFTKKQKLFLSLPVLGLVLFSIIKTNTRGPVFALLLSIITVLFIFFKIKLNIKIIMGFLTSIIIGIVVFFSAFDVSKVAVRFINIMPKDAESITPRLLAYIDSFKILFTRPLGISVGTFGMYYSDQSSVDKDTGTYAHNLFMEFISSFGIFGVILSLILIYILLFEYNFLVKNQKRIFSEPLYFISIVLLFFFFFETQFSFTLNTHKGFYLSLALYSVLKFKYLKKVKNDN
jgi:hypothetical protein